MKKFLFFVFIAMLFSLAVPKGQAEAKVEFLTLQLTSTDPWRAGTNGTIWLEITSHTKGKVEVTSLTSECGVVSTVSSSPMFVYKGQNRVIVFNAQLPSTAPSGFCTVFMTVQLKNPAGILLRSYDLS